MKRKISLTVFAISTLLLVGLLSIQSLQAQAQKPTQFYDYYKKAIESKTAIINSDPDLLREALNSGWFDKVEIGLKNAKDFKIVNNGDYTKDIMSGETCETSDPFCTDAGITYPAGTNTVAQEGPDYGCLVTVPNPAWFYMKVETAGDIEITASSSPLEDIDFIIWGPFPDINACDNLTSGNLVDCSYQPVSIEEIYIPNTQLAEYYILLITNFSNNPTDITLTQTGGNGATDCIVLNPIPPTTTSADISTVTFNSATSGGEVTDDGGLPVTARGVCWNTTGTPTISNDTTIDGKGIGVFISHITGLIELTTYYVRAYATNDIGASYGEELSFTTPEICFNPTSGGSIGTSQTNCGSFNPEEIISLSLPSGQTGTLEYKWQKSSTSAYSGFSDISNSNSSSYDPTNISSTKWYKRLARVDCIDNWIEAVESNVVEITVIQPPTANANTDDSICSGATYHLSGSATNNMSVLWITAGDGSFDDAGLLDATYTPGVNDISNGNVEIALTASPDSDCGWDDASDSMILTIIKSPEQPEVPQGPNAIDLDLIISSEYSSTLEENVLNYNWNLEPMEAGNIEWEDNIATVYWNTDFVGLTAYLNVVESNNCGEVTSEDLIISVSPVGINQYIENDLCINISPNPSDGHFKVLIENAIEDINLLIVNSSGQLIFEKKLISNTTKYVEAINISTELAGTYHLKFITEKSVIIKKVIINKSF